MDPLLKPASLLVVARPLHRGEISLYLAVLVAIDALQRELVLLLLVHQLSHPVLIRRAGGQLGAQRLVEFALVGAHRLALRFEALLRRLELRRLLVAQP